MTSAAIFGALSVSWRPHLGFGSDAIVLIYQVVSVIAYGHNGAEGSLGAVKLSEEILGVPTLRTGHVEVERRVSGHTTRIEGLHLYVSQGLGNAAGNSDKTWSSRCFAHVTNRGRICTTGYVFPTERDLVRARSHLCGGHVRTAMANDIGGRVDDCPVVLTFQVQH